MNCDRCGSPRVFPHMAWTGNRYLEQSRCDNCNAIQGTTPEPEAAAPELEEAAPRRRRVIVEEEPANG